MSKTFRIRVIDGLTSQAGTDWGDVIAPISAESAQLALDAVEAKIDADLWPRACDYGCEVGDDVIVTVIAVEVDADGDPVSRVNAERVLRYEAA